MVIPYLNFAGQAAQAIEFYERVLHGQDKRVLLYGDAPPNPEFPIGEGQKKLVLHAEMTISGTKLSFSDTQEPVNSGSPKSREDFWGKGKGSMISLAVEFKTEEEVREAYEQLKEGGEVLMELAPQFFSPLYGWVLDRFGVSWQVIYAK